jgi:hypothetical protein
MGMIFRALPEVNIHKAIRYTNPSYFLRIIGLFQKAIGIVASFIIEMRSLSFARNINLGQFREVIFARDILATALLPNVDKQ